MPSWDAPEEFLPSIATVEEATQASLARQMVRADALDTKSGLILGASGVILAILANQIAGLQEARDFTRYAAGGSFALLTIAVLCALRSLWIRSFDHPPGPQHLHDNYLMHPPGWTRLRVLDTQLLAHKKNDGILKDKAHWLLRAMSTFVAGVVVLAVALGYNLLVVQGSHVHTRPHRHRQVETSERSPQVLTPNVTQQSSSLWRSE